MFREKLKNRHFGRYVPIIGWARSHQRAGLRPIVTLTSIAVSAIGVLAGRN